MAKRKPARRRKPRLTAYQQQSLDMQQRALNYLHQMNDVLAHIEDDGRKREAGIYAKTNMLADELSAIRREIPESPSLWQIERALAVLIQLNEPWLWWHRFFAKFRNLRFRWQIWKARRHEARTKKRMEEAMPRPPEPEAIPERWASRW